MSHLAYQYQTCTKANINYDLIRKADFSFVNKYISLMKNKLQ